MLDTGCKFSLLDFRVHNRWAAVPFSACVCTHTHNPASLALPEVLLSPTTYMDRSYLHSLWMLFFLLGFTARKPIPGRGPLRVRQVEMEMFLCVVCLNCRMKK